MINKHLYMVVFFLLIGSKVYADSIELPVYGNWCGPGYPVQGENPKPIDLVDERCKLHDIQYTQCEKENDRLMCEAEADFDLVDSLRRDVDKLNRVQLVVANNIGKYFVIQGPVKATTENAKKVFIDRFLVATELKDRASNALSTIGNKFNGIKEGFTYIKDIAVDTFDYVMSEGSKVVGSEEVK